MATWYAQFQQLTHNLIFSWQGGRHAILGTEEFSTNSLHPKKYAHHLHIIVGRYTNWFPLYASGLFYQPWSKQYVCPSVPTIVCHVAGILNEVLNTLIGNLLGQNYCYNIGAFYMTNMGQVRIINVIMIHYVQSGILMLQSLAINKETNNAKGIRWWWLWWWWW